MLPTKYLDDLKNAPVDKVDFVATFFEVRNDQFVSGLAADHIPDVRRPLHDNGLTLNIASSHSQNSVECEPW